MISEVTHEFIGYFFPLAQFLTLRARSSPSRLSFSVIRPERLFPSSLLARFARGHVCRFGNASENLQNTFVHVIINFGGI